MMTKNAKRIIPNSEIIQALCIAIGFVISGKIVNTPIETELIYAAGIIAGYIVAEVIIRFRLKKDNK